MNYNGANEVIQMNYQNEQDELTEEDLQGYLP